MRQPATFDDGAGKHGNTGDDCFIVGVSLTCPWDLPRDPPWRCPRESRARGAAQNHPTVPRRLVLDGAPRHRAVPPSVAQINGSDSTTTRTLPNTAISPLCASLGTRRSGSCFATWKGMSRSPSRDSSRSSPEIRRSVKTPPTLQAIAQPVPPQSVNASSSARVLVLAGMCAVSRRFTEAEIAEVWGRREASCHVDCSRHTVVSM